MKKYLSTVLSAVLGGVIVLVGMFFINNNNQEIEKSYARQVNNVNVPKYGNAASMDFTVAAEKAMKSVVHIYAAEKQEVSQRRDPFSGFFGGAFGQFYGPKQGTGSGVIISENGYIVTNNHVVEFADDVQVTLSDNRKYDAKVIGTYPKADLAVLKIDATDLPVMEYGDPDKAKVGEWVLAVGNPLNLTSTVTAGIISAKGRDINIIPGQDAIESFIQTDAAVNPGNSGGALVDTDGKLIGINSAIKSGTGYYAGYSFAIPADLVKNIVNDIIDNGSYQRPYLGISIIEIDDEYASENNLDVSQGVAVESLANGGSAQYAGVLPGDVIVSLNDKKIKSVPELQEAVSSAKVGDVVILTVNRNGQEKEIRITLKAG